MPKTYQEHKKAIREVMDGILFIASKETQKEQAKRIKQLSELIDDPEDYHMQFEYQWEEALREALKLKKTINKDNISNIIFIYKDYGFLENNVTELIERLEGHICCADKSRFIIRSYVRYFTKNEQIKLDEDHYWIPKSFTHEQWIRFFQALHHLRYGNPEKYLKFMTEDFKPAAIALANKILKIKEQQNGKNTQKTGKTVQTKTKS